MTDSAANPSAADPCPRDAASNFGPSAPWDRLRERAELLARLRAFFDAREFLEVDTPLLSADTVVDLHIDPLAVNLFDDPRNPEQGTRYWLQTSPEFCMKRLLAAGSPPAIYQVCKAFRAAERGPLHNPEFTIVEWYRVGDDYESGIALLAELIQSLLNVPRVDRRSYRQAFLEHVGLDPHQATIEEFAAFAARDPTVQLADAATIDRDQWLNYLLAQYVEPHLGRDAPEILCDFPASQAALARVRALPDSSQRVAERFELYYRGIELANGYHELLDPNILEERNRTNNLARKKLGKQELPESSRMLDAMRSGLPPCVGVALGFDRLAMVACGAASIQEVLAFPIDRA
jgi:lysyl-tRNA synthetase class 2